LGAYAGGALISRILKIMTAHRPVVGECNRHRREQQSRSAKGKAPYLIRTKNSHDFPSLPMSSSEMDCIFRISCLPGSGLPLIKKKLVAASIDTCARPTKISFLPADRH